MADDTVYNGSGDDIAPEMLEAAKALLVKRYKYIKKPDESMKRLAWIGATHVARDMVASPERYAPLSLAG